MQSLNSIVKEQSIIDNRYNKINNNNIFKQSIIDRETERLRLLLRDSSLHQGFVAKILNRLSEYEINNFADYAVRKGNDSGRAFVGLCEKVMRQKGSL